MTGRPTPRAARDRRPPWLLPLTLVASLLALAAAPPALADDHDEEDHEEEFEDEEEFDAFEEMEFFVVELETYAMLLDLVRSFAGIAESESTAGVAAVMAVEEHAGEPEEIVEFFEDVLDDVEDEVVERAIRLKLVDFYAELDQRDKAVEQLRILITADDD